MSETVGHSERSCTYLRAMRDALLGFGAACKQVLVSTMCHRQACFDCLGLSLQKAAAEDWEALQTASCLGASLARPYASYRTGACWSATGHLQKGAIIALSRAGMSLYMECSVSLTVSS